jgi:post-segregation antitoxin (ccd killing protein)
VTVTKNRDREDNDSEDDLYEVVKAHSDQISRLTDMVEPLQSQIKRIETRKWQQN